MHIGSRATSLLVLFLVVAGCGKKKDLDSMDDGPELQWPPGFTCPFGAEPAGHPPPDGLEIWCQVQHPSGRWQKNGPYRSWHGNGQYSAMGQYDGDRKSGTWTEWYANGKPAAETGWVNGGAPGSRRGVLRLWPEAERRRDGGW